LITDHRVSDIRVSALYYYPVKSCAGTALRTAEFGPRGIVHDREFMVVDASARFVTQREQPRLALVRPRRTEQSLELSAPGMPLLALDVNDGSRFEACIWRDRVMVADQGAQAAEWVSAYLQQDCRLVRLPEDVTRPVDPEYAVTARDQVSLADGYPALLVSEESLSDLNSRLDQPLPMNRFRPNIVVRGSEEAYAEDGWAEIQVSSMWFSVVKACARCVITTTDQETAERGQEPLLTLASYRRIPRGVLFGQNLIHRAAGHISVGDRVNPVVRAPYSER
jgi:uncharacterized protein YcbX